MKTFILSVILAACGLMTTSSAFATTVSTAVNTNAVNDSKILKFVSHNVTFAQTDQDYNVVKDSEKSANKDSYITVAEKEFIFNVNGSSNTLNIIKDYGDQECGDGDSVNVYDCIDSEGTNCKVSVLISKDHQLTISVFTDNHVFTFNNIDYIEQ